METYDDVAAEYANVFNDIRLRRFEWPWLQRLIKELKPHSLLDLGCGNGYLLEALLELIPNLYGVEPSVPMLHIARKRLGQSAALFHGRAENLPFAGGYFDMVVSLLSFRYMDWDKAAKEIHRVLKPEGTFILIDLFSAGFNPLYLGLYVKAWIVVRLQYMENNEYHRKLKDLSQNPNWLKMTQENPKRELATAKQAMAESFYIQKEKLLDAGLRGKTVGIVFRKKKIQKEI